MTIYNNIPVGRLSYGEIPSSFFCEKGVLSNVLTPFEALVNL